MSGWSFASRTDFSGHQIELILMFSIFIVMAIWVFYDSSKYFMNYKRHIFWVFTLFTGPIAMVTYLLIRRNADY